MPDNPIDYGWEKAIWDKLVPFYGGNEFAAAGTMGNWYTESYLVPFQMEKDSPAGSISSDYTSKVDAGTIGKATFINGYYNGKGPGYGLAQWTYSTRKQRMYDFWNTDEFRGGGISIGSVNFEIAWFEKEMVTWFPNTYAGMKSQTNVDRASDYFLRYFEGIWNSSYINRRAQSRYYYEKYTGTAPDPGPEPDPDPPAPPDPPIPEEKKKFKWIYYMRRKY